MAYTPPIFNVDCNIWHAPSLPPAAPDLFTQCQLYVNSRGLLDIDEFNDVEWVPPVYLRLPFGTDVRRLDLVECGAGTGNWYHVRWVERMHLGFTNQYTVALLNQLPQGPPGAGDVLLESGDKVLLESGDIVLLE